MQIDNEKLAKKLLNILKSRGYTVGLVNTREDSASLQQVRNTLDWCINTC